MPRIFDNIEQHLLPALIQTLAVSERADLCVGYFNLRGWKQLGPSIEAWPGGEGHCVRLLVGMHSTPQDELRQALSLNAADRGMDNSQAARLKRRLALEFRRQLMQGAPTNQDEAGLRQLARQLENKQVIVKLFLRHTLHAKLYLLFRDDYNNPISGYLGSSNLTFAGLSYQGELNVDVLDHDACLKLAHWFEDRWNDRFCLDISQELIQVLQESWAINQPTPYHIYLKMAYHLAQEARAGVSEFTLPAEFRTRLFDFQAAAVKIAAHHLNRRGGVLIGDVVGLGKTLMATALARIVEEDTGVSTLIICPKNLTAMWQSYVDEYGLRAKVMSLSVAIRDLPDVPARFRLVILDESHNLRNRESKRYRAIKEYIDQSDSRCILLTATPYNKSYLDLSAQLRLFVPEDLDLGVRPERLLREAGEAEFSRYQTLPNTLVAFEKSPFADDWRELMRLYMVRRTRSFIQAHYAETDPVTGRKFLRLEDGSPSYFPVRVPRTLRLVTQPPQLAEDTPEQVRETDSDPYARLYSDEVVQVIGQLCLPRYGLGNYVAENAARSATARSVTAEEKRMLASLGRAGKRLIGYCRTNLFKRLESSGQAFIQSLDRHVLRNHVFLYALEHGLPLPLGTQDAEMLDPGNEDEDAELIQTAFEMDEDEPDANNISDVVESEDETIANPFTPQAYRQRAQQVYQTYRDHYRRRFTWLRSTLFTPALREHLLQDADQLLGILQASGTWDADRDHKLARLHRLIVHDHPDEKILIFTQFADTVHYLTAELGRRGVAAIAGATGHSENPTALAWRFSPISNDKSFSSNEQLRVLIATDVLSEGQNLQDAHIVVNYDLPWAIIRLVQRAGRVDRIGQKAAEIQCYSFLPADGVEQIIRLRARVRRRLQENGEVIGTDEQFFEDERTAQQLRDLYTEKSGILDDEPDSEVDLASFAYQIWHDAIRANPALEAQIAALPDVVFSTKAARQEGGWEGQEGVLVYMKTADDTDALAWVDEQGRSVTQSQLAVLRAAACTPDTPALPHHPQHHELVSRAVEQMTREMRTAGGQLGRPSGARYKAYTRLKAYYERLRASASTGGELHRFAGDDLARAIDDLYRYPLRETAKDSLNRQIKAAISDEDLARLVVALRDENRLSLIAEEGERVEAEARIICSLGLAAE